MKYLEFIFQSFWHFTGFAILLYIVMYFIVNGLLTAFSRMLRSINILSRGWPPSHVDADGDFKGKVQHEINPVQ